MQDGRYAHEDNGVQRDMYDMHVQDVDAIEEWEDADTTIVCSIYMPYLRCHRGRRRVIHASTDGYHLRARLCKTRCVWYLHPPS